MANTQLKQTLLACLLFIALGFLIYSNSLNGEFLYDDILNIKGNPIVHNAQNLRKISGYHASRFFPYFSFALNYFFHQERTFGYHLTNVLIHILNACFVFLLSRMILKTKKFSQISGQNCFLFSLLSGLIFLAHPVQTQAVSWIVQRITLLSTAFYLGSIVLYLQSRLENRMISRVLSIILCAMAMASRENSATLPFIICFLEIALIQGSHPASKKALVKSLAPFFLCIAIIPLLLNYSIGWGRPLASIVRETADITRSTYFFTQASVLNSYLSLFLFPVYQCADYDYPLTESLFSAPFLTGAGILLFITFCFIRWRKRHPVLLMGWAWFLITLSVESSIFPIKDVIQEHRLYLPLIGLSWITAFVIVEKVRPRARMILMILIIAGLSFLTIKRNLVWQTESAFWQDVALKSPLKSRGIMGMGTVYLRKNDFSKAETYLLKAIELDPKNIAAYANLSIMHSMNNDFEKALPFIRAAHELNPYDPLYIHILGHVYFQLAQYEQSFYFYKKLLDEFFSAYIADQYFRLLVQYYEKTHDLGATLEQARALEPHFKSDEYNEILEFLKRLAPAAP
ncbi:MAG TPA: hypothetical protein P5246_04115 [Candidatus Omnitrophota bacterium]|nr:hypothetical protein [Candidatus Omnitrophota bacterium]HSA31017.1 hypothetical protein [Candidatus Omnitrophota bacterium]